MFYSGRLGTSSLQLFSIQGRSFYNASRKVKRQGKIWREEHKLPAHINQTKALMDGADFRYLDGRPTPYGIKQYQRISDQKELTMKVIQNLGEMNFVIQSYKQLEMSNKKHVKEILDRKLKPKGGFIKG